MLPAPPAAEPRPGRWTNWLATACLGALLASCADPKQAPAERAIADIEAALASAGTGPAKYIPGELEDAQSDLARLKQDFERRDYAAVLDAAPGVLEAAHALAASAAAREVELHQTLRVEWAAMAQSVPVELASTAERLDRWATRTSPSADPTSARIASARSQLRDALALWDRARQEATAGRLPEAVTLARQVRELGRAVDALSQAGATDAPLE